MYVYMPSSSIEKQYPSTRTSITERTICFLQKHRSSIAQTSTRLLAISLSGNFCFVSKLFLIRLITVDSEFFNLWKRLG